MYVNAINAVLGIIKVDGSDATGEGAGGGSGGTIVISSRSLLGDGTVSTNGGQGSGQGGGGAGGRIKLTLTERYIVKPWLYIYIYRKCIFLV